MRLPSLLLVAFAPALLAEPPKAVPPGCTVELVASDPDLRTPTAIAVDARGRVWVLENNTHFRPKNYGGPPTDRVLILDDFGSDGRARKITTYADGFSDGMGLLLLPGGDAILSTRAATLRLHDADGDGRADDRRTLLTLVTDDKYPHNGLSGITRAPDGTLFLGLGENHGFPWTLTGSDGAVVRGSDEGGIFHFDDEGRGLVHWALGVWNPFGLACDPAGRLFALDNDPGGGSFCRLLHIVKNGDYGYRYRYGRTIDHPFISWDGRWPGTLPPMCYVGEAPTGLLWHGGELLGCTWTDHGVQRFPLETRGASFTTKPDWLLRGGQDFRPSGIAAAPDGTLYVSDWVDGSYDVHGKGRVWRVRGVKAELNAPMPVTEPEKQLASFIEEKTSSADALALLHSDDRFLFRAAVLTIAKDAGLLAQHAADADAKVRLGALLALRHSKAPFPPEMLKDSDPGVRRAALEWIGVERLTAFAGQIDDALEGNPSRLVFHAYLAAAELLTSEKIDADGKVSTAARFQRVADIALDRKRKPELRALALRLLPVQHPALTLDALRALIAEPPLSAEAAHILASRSDEPAQAEMRKLASDPATPVRAEALAGLVHSAGSPETRDLLQKAAASDYPIARREASRSLGQPLPATEASFWPDPAAGRRLFFHPRGPLCATCHQIEGRGRAIGPDLTGVWRMSEEQLLEAIREPSKAIAPAFVQWHIKLRDGREATGIDQFIDNKSDFTLLDAAGTLTRFRFADVVEREPLPISLMPPGLIDGLTPQERSDLIAYLREPRE
jgi:putative membrane-bound dehydrogenase-like protein